MLRLSRLLVILGVCASVPAWASGYDTPMLYSAQHMGMAGTAIGAVDDPSAIFHNPAGLSQSGKASALVTLSPLMGQIHGSPDNDARSIGSNTAVSPFFFVGGAYKVHDRVTVGAAAYLLGGAAGTYSYDFTRLGNTYHTEDAAKLSFIEVAPTVSVKILDNLRFGVTWRPVITNFERTRFDTPSDGAQITNLDLNMKGIGWGGVRLGLQYNVGPVSMGLTFRNRVNIDVKADTITYASSVFNNATYQYILPAKLGYGLQWKVNDDLRLAVDFEYVFNSQNDVVYLAGTQEIAGKVSSISVPNRTDWSDSFTVRVGAGYHVTKPLEIRAGYLLDTASANTRYPTAFGSPPGPTHFGTVGVGYKFSELFDMSFATAVRYGSATVTDDQSPAKQVHKEAPFAGYPGNYSIFLTGVYLDARFHFGAPDSHKISDDPTPAPAPAPAPEVPAAPAETPAPAAGPGVAL